MIGRTVGHFRLVGHLGRGTSGTVYRAVDEILNREVALKILNPGQVDPDAVARFRAEATTLGRLTHPAIATLYEMFEADGHLVMAMECVHGDTLDEMVDRFGPLPSGRAAYVTDRILAALDHAHRAGVLHCDIKPANIVVSDSGVKIMDFGIARMLGEHSADEGLLGTPAYMAPEQVLGEPLDPRTDLYAVGVIFYRLLTGTLPFEAETPAAVLQRQITDAPPPLRSHRGDVPAWCEPIVQRALAKRAADRFQSADEFRRALARETVLTPPASHRLVPAGGLRPMNEALGLAAAAGIVGLLAFAGMRSAMPATPPPPRLPAAAAVEPAPAAAEVEIPLTPTTTSAAPTDTENPVPPPRVEKPARPSFSHLEFDTKALVADGRKARERNARLVLADRTLTVMDGEAGRLLYSVPYDNVTSISYSHSRDPLWASPDGPVAVVHTSGGVLRTLGLSVEHAWVSLATNTGARFVVLRVGDDEVTHLLEALQQRTHRTVQRLQPRRDSASGPVL